MTLSHNPYDTDHATLTRQEQSEAWWRGSSCRFAKPFTEDVSFTDDDHLTEGYNSRKVDVATWAKIAFHLAAGVPIIKIAEQYKVSRSTIWRALSRSHNLRRRVAEERALMRREADSRFVAIRELVVDTIYRAVADGNMRATLWAAERLGLGMELLQQAEKPPKPGYARVAQTWWPTDAKARAILADLDAPPGTRVPLPMAEESPPAEPRQRRRRIPLHPHGFIPPHPERTAAVEGTAVMEGAAQDDAAPIPLSPSSRRTPGPRGQAPDLDAASLDAAATNDAGGPWTPACAGEAGEDITPEPPPFANVTADPVPHLPSLDADAMGDPTDLLPDFPPALRFHRRPPRPRVKASAPPAPHHPGPSRRLSRGSYSIRPRSAVRLLAWLLHNSLPVADGVAGAPGLTAARWVARARFLAWGNSRSDL